MSEENVEIACTSCSRHHLTTAAALLAEASRMSKNRSLSDSEIQDRISLVEQEIDVMERVDLNSKKLSNLPEGAREVTRKMLNDIRSKVRHPLESTGLRWGKGNINDLEKIAGDASEINNQYLQDITPYHLNKMIVTEPIVERKPYVMGTDEKTRFIKNMKRNEMRPIMNNFRNIIPKPLSLFEELRPRHYLEILKKTAAEGEK